jgi:hypothetical protein
MIVGRMLKKSLATIQLSDAVMSADCGIRSRWTSQVNRTHRRNASVVQVATELKGSSNIVIMISPPVVFGGCGVPGRVR